IFSLSQASQRHISACLNQIVRNAMPLATIKTANASLQADYAKQMFAGVRRLLAVQHLYAKKTRQSPPAPYTELRQYLAPGYRNTATARAVAASGPFQSCLLAFLQDLVTQAESAST